MNFHIVVFAPLVPAKEMNQMMWMASAMHQHSKSHGWFRIATASQTHLWNDWGSFSLTATHSIAIPAHCSGHTASHTQINWFVWFEWLEQCSNISHHIVVLAPLPPARQSDLNHPKWPKQFRAVHQHDPSHRCVRTAAPSQANWFNWSKWLKQYTNMNHHIVAFAPLPPASNNFC